MDRPLNVGETRSLRPAEDLHDVNGWVARTQAPAPDNEEVWRLIYETGVKYASSSAKCIVTLTTSLLTALELCISAKV